MTKDSKYQELVCRIERKCTKETLKETWTSENGCLVEQYIFEGLEVYIDYHPHTKEKQCVEIWFDEQLYEELYEEFGIPMIEVNYEIGIYDKNANFNDIKFCLGSLWSRDKDDFVIKYWGDRVKTPGERTRINPLLEHSENLDEIEDYRTFSKEKLYDIDVVLEDAIMKLTFFLKNKNPEEYLEERRVLKQCSIALELYRLVQKVAKRNIVIEEKPKEAEIKRTNLDDDSLSVEDIETKLENQEKINETKRQEIARKKELLEKLQKAMEEEKKLDEEESKLDTEIEKIKGEKKIPPTDKGPALGLEDFDPLYGKNPNNGEEPNDGMGY